MSGRILSIRVKPGDSVNSGDEMCVIEAMKMEQAIKAHRDGVVKKVFVKPLDQVPINATLVELEST
jgi:biotin carboxyl carrier protein